MWKTEESYNKETKEGEVEDKESISRAVLTAGTALLMAACLRRAVILFLVEQWRVWVFLVVNLIVLAIFFSSNPSKAEPSGCGENRECPNVRRKERKIKKRECGGLTEKVEKIEIKQEEEEEEEQVEKKIKEEEENEEQEDDGRLSKEELNERVEAFIIMFKQHLISDAKKWENKTATSH